MTHSPADIVRKLLVDAGQGVASDNTSTDWQCFASGEPSNPDNCITVYDTEGTSDGRHMVNGQLQYHYGIQLRIRGIDHKTGYDKAQTLRTWISEACYLATVSIDSSRYLVHAITHIGQVIALGKDVPRSKRNLFTINATVPLRQLA